MCFSEISRAISCYPEALWSAVDGEPLVGATVTTPGSTSGVITDVDGSPYPASLSNIPQGDIESITVLKDAASAAIYGARGAPAIEAASGLASPQDLLSSN